jgi:hypothetical protein
MSILDMQQSLHLETEVCPDPRGANIRDRAATIFAELDGLSLSEKVEAINDIRASLAEHSPFKSEPVDFVRWVPNAVVTANDYNPNAVAPPEMELLRVSINADGFTQPKSEAYKRYKEIVKDRKEKEKQQQKIIQFAEAE